MVLKEIENDLHILKVYYHNREDHRIKYSFVVDETTTTEVINESMAGKLHLDRKKYSYRLVNHVPAGEGELRCVFIEIVFTI